MRAFRRKPPCRNFPPTLHLPSPRQPPQVFVLLRSRPLPLPPRLFVPTPNAPAIGTQLTRLRTLFFCFSSMSPFFVLRIPLSEAHSGAQNGRHILSAICPIFPYRPPADRKLSNSDGGEAQTPNQPVPNTTFHREARKNRTPRTPNFLGRELRGQCLSPRLPAYVCRPRTACGRISRNPVRSPSPTLPATRRWNAEPLSTNTAARPRPNKARRTDRIRKPSAFGLRTRKPRIPPPTPQALTELPFGKKRR